jgi:hypothetical protein
MIRDGLTLVHAHQNRVDFSCTLRDVLSTRGRGQGLHDENQTH